MSWLKECEICNAGLCAAVDSRKAKGLGEHAACKEMSEESKGLYSAKQILDRYRYHTGKDKKVSEIPKAEIRLTEDEIIQTADAIREKRIKAWREKTKDLCHFIENYMNTDVVTFTNVGLKFSRPLTKEECIDYGCRLKELEFRIVAARAEYPNV